MARKTSTSKEPLPERVCPVCGKTFIPKSAKAIYHAEKCKVKALRQRKRQAEWIAALDGDLERLRVGLPETARMVETLTLRHGLEVGRAALSLSLAAAKEFKDLYDSRMKEPNGVGR